jgi:hypothetical protein
MPTTERKPRKPRAPKSPPKDMAIKETVVGTEITNPNINIVTDSPANSEQQTGQAMPQPDTPSIHDGLPPSDFLADVEAIADEIPPIVEQLPAPAVAAEKPAPKKLILKIGIDQIGIGDGTGLQNKVFSEFEATITDERPLDVAYAAGHMARHLFPVIKALGKAKSAGFNVVFYIEDTLVEGFKSKTKGNFKMATPSDLAFGIANIIISAVDNQNNYSYLTGVTSHSKETRMFVDRIGLHGSLSNVTAEGLFEAFDVKRKLVKKKFAEGKKQLLASLK